VRARWPPLGWGKPLAAIALATIMDSPIALSTQPAAARQLGAITDSLRPTVRRGRLASVRTLTSSDPRHNRL